jgi:predicted enzyme related to lactoylglutathione lyase
VVDVGNDVTVGLGRRKEGGVDGRTGRALRDLRKDASKLQSFYADLFGWEIHADNPMNYGIVHTNSGDKGIGGGITEGDARVNVVVDVDDLQKYLDKAVSMGAEVVTPITEFPDMVTWAEFRDPAGSVIGISLADS